jgi:hypothetical protein
MFVVFVPFFQQLDPIQICEVQQNDALAGPEACQVRRHKPATLKDVERWKMLNQNLRERDIIYLRDAVNPGMF